jgi:hypothetical protein
MPELIASSLPDLVLPVFWTNAVTFALNLHRMKAEGWQEKCVQKPPDLSENVLSV